MCDVCGDTIAKGLNVDQLPDEHFIELAAKEYERFVFKDIPTQSTLETDFMDSYRSSRDLHNLTDVMHQEAIERSIKSLNDKGLVEMKKTVETKWILSLTTDGEKLKKKFSYKLFGWLE